MRIKIFSLSVILIAGLLFSKRGNCQCDTCPQNHPPLDERAVNRLSTNYKNNYHQNRDEKKKHSVSVDFSREAVMNFYKKVFIDQKKYHGVDIYPICFNKPMPTLPKHIHDKQIGLMIVASDSNCKSNFNEFSIHNNSFNQIGSHYESSNGTHYCDSTEVAEYTTYYRNNFPDSQNHTTVIHYGEDIISVFYKILKADTKYKGLRFYFTSYNMLNQACGQVTDKQITVTIVTIGEKGEDNYDAFSDYLRSEDFLKNYKENQKNEFLSALNHGSLCPNYCPH